MKAFGYERPETLSDALDILAANPAARPIAGGMTLLPTLKQRLGELSVLVDLSGLPFLSEIELDPASGKLVIGAMATHAAVARSPVVHEHLSGLASLARVIGDVQVRNRGTIGGSVANNDPAADYPAALLAADATIVTDRREIPASDFFAGLFETALEPDELVVSIEFVPGTELGYAKFRHPVSGYAMAGVCVSRQAGAIAVAVTGAGPGVFRCGELEEALATSFAPHVAREVRIRDEFLLSDMHADARYRARLVQEMAAQAVASLG